MGSLFKSIAKVALPIAGTLLAPGIGTALGSSLSAAALSGVGGALGGAAGGALGGGGLKGALKGGALGGVGGYVGGGALGTPGTSINWTSGIPGAKLGTEVVGGSGFLGGLSAGKGLGGAFAQGAKALLPQAVGGTGGGGGLLSTGANLYSGIQGTQGYKDMAKAQNAATGRAIDVNRPFLNSGTAANNRLSGLLGLDGENQDDILELLRNSPGYQFRLNQGQDSLNKSLSARGKVFSGEALKQSQELGQGLADQTYNDYVEDLYRQSASGQAAAGNVGNLYQDQGNVSANSILGQNNSINQALAGILNGTYNPQPQEDDEDVKHLMRIYGRA